MILKNILRSFLFPIRNEFEVERSFIFIATFGGAVNKFDDNGIKSFLHLAYFSITLLYTEEKRL